MSSKRLLFLEKTIEGGSKDPFHWYALGMEYAGLGRIDDALDTFTKLRTSVSAASIVGHSYRSFPRKTRAISLSTWTLIHPS